MAREEGKRKGRGRKNDRRGGDKPQKEFEEVLLEVRRVTRVTTGGRQLSFRAIILIGNRKGKIAIGVAKGSDVSIAVTKATHEAYKNIVEVPVTDQLSVPYEITHKYKAAKVKLLPAASGTGLKAGSSVRTVLALAGYNNILSKIMGTNNKLNNAIAAIQALAKYKVGKFPEKVKKQATEEGEGGEEKAAAPKAKAQKTEKTEKAATPTKKVPAAGDDLTKIEGIGPKIQEVLHTAGIKSYNDLSSSKVGDLRSLLEENKLAQHDPSTWKKQATLAKKGDWDTLKVLQDELIGGKVEK